MTTEQQLEQLKKDYARLAEANNENLRTIKQLSNSLKAHLKYDHNYIEL